MLELANHHLSIVVFSCLRIIDGEKYDKLVLGKESSNAIIHNMIDKIQDAIGEENEAT